MANPCLSNTFLDILYVWGPPFQFCHRTRPIRIREHVHKSKPFRKPELKIGMHCTDLFLKNWLIFKDLFVFVDNQTKISTLLVHVIILAELLYCVLLKMTVATNYHAYSSTQTSISKNMMKEVRATISFLNSNYLWFLPAFFPVF